ncbi:MAG: tetratricopeptide repeat protein [Saprospiraceae bacterium]|nr:tetratricopeptide repeat protein [Saprospiraceae bacterium]
MSHKPSSAAVTPTVNPLKLIFRGRLEFGSQRTYDIVVKHWQTRTETYFKADILLKPELVFKPEEYALDVPQSVINSTEKHWRSTTALLKEVAQFALAGNVGAWWVANGQILDQYIIEPTSEKTAVVEYINGRTLLNQAGMEKEAMEALNRAIEKFEKHALAYERRGYVNYKLKNYNDALYDFSKSIDINPNNPEPHYGRGKIRMMKNEWLLAAEDFSHTIQMSLAVQPIHWLARLRKADSLFHAKQYAAAIPELKFFLQRKFEEADPNFRFRSKAEFLLAESEKALKQQA